MLFLPGRGLNFGIEFRGGAEFRFTSAAAQEGQIRDAVEEAGVTGEQRIIKEGTDTWRVQTDELTTAEAAKVRTALSEAFDVPEVNSQSIGPTWGADVSKKAGQALAVFLALIVLYLTFTFEWKMAIAALVALSARPADHHRDLRPRRVRGDSRVGDRAADDSRLFPL